MKRSFHSHIPPSLFLLKNRLRERFSGSLPDRTAEVSGHTIRIPPEHPLKAHIANIRLYNAFLPVLAGMLESGGPVVDIGANVGDTAISMLPYCKNPVICVEPSDRYLRYLRQNIGSLTREDRERIILKEWMIGTGTHTGKLTHERGTAYLETDALQSSTLHTLDELLENESDIALLKADTDGFDFDVLLSGMESIRRLKPILFWENQIDHTFQLTGFSRLYAELSEAGYRHFCLFDNYGAIICRTNDPGMAADINNYLYHQKAHGGMRTFEYTDILACTDKDIGIFEASTERYLREHMMK
jgi:FkbM family methyltransferase